ncbi:VOC family protein [Enterococcus sp. BWB1-3]|uniref:VOC family protein n=1 Tax=unclassified Enterococcus TaxID=2608891 RepID=UPI0019222A9D|nr:MULTISPECIES: VOC family protein [unclassified Enterococcus]MBL1229583.1 VOC family protein [Enterococcus sp. BWB1-3]MCB5950726.1 VOC family protein [Enterococcus sp. BWT-B8]MCB5955965.1 VOC family protein [Enterococcus sp. CWB-B31]
MKLGNFSVSFPVKDLHASMKFYEVLGFKQVSGDVQQNWCVLQNGEARIGLFQGMFDESFLTFNPKWNANKETEDGMEDIRKIAGKIEKEGYSLELGASLDGENAGYFFIKDPDGHKILFDQHV